MEARAGTDRSGRTAEHKHAGAALKPEDAVWSKTAVHRQRVEGALTAVERASEQGAIGVSFSGGKDSTVTLDLVRRVVPDAPAAFFDSGAELPSTLALVREVGAEVCTPRMTMAEMARYAGWWGYAEPVDPECDFDAKLVLIQEPSEAFVVRRRLRVIAHGVRAQESRGRAKHGAARGEVYQGADRTWVCMPVLRWELSDVWAYIAERGLAYNTAYDEMTRCRIPRHAQRVAGMLGERGSGWGRHTMLKRYAPQQWRELVAEFPALAMLAG